MRQYSSLRRTTDEATDNANYVHFSAVLLKTLAFETSFVKETCRRTGERVNSSPITSLHHLPRSLHSQISVTAIAPICTNKNYPYRRFRARNEQGVFYVVYVPLDCRHVIVRVEDMESSGFIQAR